MWIKATNRRELIDILQTERNSGAEDTLFPRRDFGAVSALSPELLDDELLLVWQDDPRDSISLPNAIITKSRESRDFLAWAATYVHALRPLTAYVRVTDYQIAERAMKIQNPPSLQRLENACIGLMLGETATHLGGMWDLKQASVRTCASASSYSFAMARALGMGSVSLDTDDVSKTWFEAREATRQPSLSLDRSVLSAPWRVLLGLEHGTWKENTKDRQLGTLPRSVFDACLDLYVQGEVNSRQWSALNAQMPGIDAFAEVMRGPREERVQLLEKSIDQLRDHSPATPPLLAFVIGYMASQIAPGTLDHLHL